MKLLKFILPYFTFYFWFLCRITAFVARKSSFIENLGPSTVTLFEIMAKNPIFFS